MRLRKLVDPKEGVLSDAEVLEMIIGRMKG